MDEVDQNYTLPVARRRARGSLGGMIVAGFLLGCEISLHAAEPQPSSPGPGVVGVSNLEGIWDQVEELRMDDCRSLTLTISASGTTQLEIRADERLQCDSVGEYILHYSGSLFQNRGKFFISLAPPSDNTKMKPVEPVGNSRENYYSPDRLTLRLSRDGCELAGSRDDLKSPPVGVGYLTVKKRDCSNRD